MPIIPQKDRSVATIENLEDFFYELGPVDKNDKITVEGIQFEVLKG